MFFTFTLYEKITDSAFSRICGLWLIIIKIMGTRILPLELNNSEHINSATYKTFILQHTVQKYPSIGVGITASWLECAFFCLQNKRCASFCFVMTSLTCQLSQLYQKCLNDVDVGRNARCFGRPVMVRIFSYITVSTKCRDLCWYLYFT